MSVKDKTVDIFDEEVKDEEVKDVASEDEIIVEHDDVKEGLMAESDPATRMKDPLAEQKLPAVDVVKESLDKQLTALGRKTAEALNAQPKQKVVVPFKDLNPTDEYVVAGTNGWNMQIRRGVPVMLPEEIILRLAEAGEHPTLVR